MPPHTFDTVVRWLVVIEDDLDIGDMQASRLAGGNGMTYSEQTAACRQQLFRAVWREGME